MKHSEKPTTPKPNITPPPQGINKNYIFCCPRCGMPIELNNQIQTIHKDTKSSICGTLVTKLIEKK